MALKKKNKFVAILGARPNFIKAAPLLLRAKSFPEFEFHLIHTGQHYDANMSQIFFDQLGLPTPQTHLEIGEYKQSEKLGRMINGINSTLNQISPQAVLVFGDVNSSLAGALAAIGARMPLVHIEAGLRSHDQRMPEETNRFIIDHLSSILFVTEPDGYANLIKECIPEHRICYVGNLMIEALEIYRPQIKDSTILKTIKLKPREFTVVTVHRDENISNRTNLEAIVGLIEALAKTRTIVFPIHPHTRDVIQTAGLTKKLGSVKLIEPLGYFDFGKLVAESAGVLTDSGGIQEETSHLGIPCATLRDNTERPVTLTQGTNQLFSLTATPEEINQHLSRRDFVPRTIPLWDDHVSSRILNRLSAEFVQ